MRRSRWGLGPRLLAAMALVAAVATAATYIVAMSIGPRLFHVYIEHEAGADHEVFHYAEDAFVEASTASLSAALLAALVVSILLSMLLTRRIARSLGRLRMAVSAIAGGDYQVRVPPVEMGTEFDELADGFNSMAGELSRIEQTRTRLLSDLGHEMRTPVATLDGYLEGVQDGVVEPDTETVALLREQVARLSRLAGDISTVTAAEEGRLDMQPLKVTLAQVLDPVIAHATSRRTAQDVELDISGTAAARDVALWADPDRIGQVFTNLLDNALRHTPPGGHIRVIAAPEDGRVRILVTDDGDGIAAEHLAHIFERFYRVDTARTRDQGGSGIGLAVVRGIVHAHGGTIHATSPGLGQGSTLTVDLPTERSGAAIP